MKARYFVTLSIILLGVFILGLRHNNITVNNMKVQLLERDRAGENVRHKDTGEVEELREYAFNHMNASVNITLQGAYERARVAAEASTDDAVNGDLYRQAEEYCERDRAHVSQSALCVHEYIESRSGEVAEAVLPDIREYSHTYHSPKWIWDLPGLALLGAILSGMVATILYVRHHVRRFIKRDR